MAPPRGRAEAAVKSYAQCRSNKGAPGIDGQDFADIEAYGVERWLAELALALRQETYRPEPIRRVFIPKANGKLRPLGISSVRDRVCMTATLLVLEPIFEADLPPETYAYRAGRNAQQAVVAVEELLFRGHPDVVDADLADYFGSLPHADLLKSVARRIVDRRVLLVADYTGQVNGVYFEAGFALGLGLTVIPTCRADEVPKLHFDIKHLNTLLWKSPAELAEGLNRRIRAVIGAGPDAPDPK